MSDSSHAELLRRTTSYDRRDHGLGVVSWDYRYWSPQTIHHAATSTSLEIGVQLGGRWLHEGSMLGKDLFERGAIHRLNKGETFEVAFDAATSRGAQVGFAIYADEMPELRDLDGELRFAGDSGTRDRELFTLCEWLQARPREETESAPEIRRTILSYIRKYAELEPPDPLLSAKKELEIYFDRELRIEHIADVAGMHPVTFARHFKRRFGMTPVTYRLRWRLHHAGRLAWSHPELSIRDVAERSGFNHLSFFHRLFRATFGLAPAEWRLQRVRERSSVPSVA